MKDRRPVHSALARDGDIDAIIEPMEVEGCEVDRDDEAGTINVREEHGEVVFCAIRKGAEGEPWICMYYNAGRFAWARPAMPEGSAE